MNKIYRLGVALLISGATFACSGKSNSEGDKAFNRGAYREAVYEYSQDLKYNPNDVILLFNRGRAHEEQGQLDSAIADFERALALEPNNFQVLLAISNLHYSQDNYSKALIYASKAEEIPGAPAMAAFMKGRALHQMGRTEDAMKAYGNAIQVDKNFAQAYFNRGMLKVALKQKRGACEDFQLAKSLEYQEAAAAIAKFCK
ncbi:MAG: tetratricopeptide repeat protein [Algoriphagus sp.]|uniref:tetratricopeptide repeat protein n=1 Tax=Algoriphagus sp. TaxID=1872435 RepID=UPI0017C4CDE3|nr:tetratricopeptide repeat protein [Algoriphagus sp.]NVJ87612.1 tetratricopeptide repeat protein [Algoriphagus sp.]